MGPDRHLSAHQHGGGGGPKPGDRILLYTDGILEARSPCGRQFGLDQLIAFAVKAAADRLPPPDITRRLVHAILD